MKNPLKIEEQNQDIAEFSKLAWANLTMASSTMSVSSN